MSSKVLFTAASYVEKDFRNLWTLDEAPDDCATAHDLSFISLAGELDGLTVSTCEADEFSEIQDGDGYTTPTDVKTVCSSGDESDMISSEFSAEFGDETEDDDDLKTSVYGSDVFSMNTAQDFSTHTVTVRVAETGINCAKNTDNFTKSMDQCGTNSFYQLPLLNETSGNRPRTDFASSFYQAAELRDINAYNFAASQQSSSNGGETRHWLLPTATMIDANCGNFAAMNALDCGAMNGGISKAVHSEYCYDYSDNYANAL